MPSSPSGRSPAPRRTHQKVDHTKFWHYFEHSQCEVYQSPFDVRLVKNIGQLDHEFTTVVQPDISIISDLQKLDDRGCEGAPDLTVEVLSPSTMKKDYYEKFNLYMENGVREYLLVNPEGRFMDFTDSVVVGV
jgi:Uma2 family endonuclease